MTHLVTLAHRVSGIHARYSGIHSSVFGLSLSLLKSLLRRANRPDYCQFQSDLMLLIDELLEVKAVLEKRDMLQPATTLGGEFADTLEEYITALSKAIEQLAVICDSICREIRDMTLYSEEQRRADRAAYDRFVQHYQRNGDRLTVQFKRL